jgi:hypothetical protein
VSGRLRGSTNLKGILNFQKASFQGPKSHKVESKKENKGKWPRVKQPMENL